MSKISAPGGELEGKWGAAGWDLGCTAVEEHCMLVAGGRRWLGGCHSRHGPCQVTVLGETQGRVLGDAPSSGLFSGWTWTLLVWGFEDLQVTPAALVSFLVGPGPSWFGVLKINRSPQGHCSGWTWSLLVWGFEDLQVTLGALVSFLVGPGPSWFGVLKISRSPQGHWSLFWLDLAPPGLGF